MVGHAPRYADMDGRAASRCDYGNALKHIDFAAENNIDGVLFEGWNKGWENWAEARSSTIAKRPPNLTWKR